MPQSKEAQRMRWVIDLKDKTLDCLHVEVFLLFKRSVLISVLNRSAFLERRKEGCVKSSALFTMGEESWDAYTFPKAGTHCIKCQAYWQYSMF